jgi:hypothetical protein
MTDEERIKLGIDVLFFRHGDASDDLERIAAFYDFIADRIRYEERRLDCDTENLRRFEAVYLILQDTLREFPVGVSNQVSEIFRENKLCELFATLAASPVNGDGMIDLNPDASSWRHFLAAVARFFSGGSWEDDIGATRGELFHARTALKRVASILRYARGLDLGERDEVLDEAKESYNPGQINKAKLLAHLTLLRSQVESVPDSENRQRLLKIVERVEAELKRKKIRWSRVIAGLFVLFSVAADFKTLSPSGYDAIYNTANKIIWTIHTEGLVRTSLSQSLPLLPNPSGNNPKSDAPDMLVPRRVEGVQDFEEVEED